MSQSGNELYLIRNFPVSFCAGSYWVGSPRERAAQALSRDTAGKGDRAVKLTRSAAAIGAAVMLAGAAAAGCGSNSSSSASGAAAPAKLTVWRMGGSVASQVTWMNGVVAQFHRQFPQYAKTQVVVKWIPWGDRTTDWNTALSSGKNIPDITELGNTDTPTEAASGRSEERRVGK